MIEFLKEDTTHVVVMFDCGTRKSKQLVDLVPRSWLICYEQGIIFCCYPPKKDYDQINDWAKKMIDPDPTWKKIRVTARKEAVGYEQGMRRLERSYSRSDIDSTDVEAREAATNDFHPIIFSDSEIQDQLEAESFSTAKKKSKNQTSSVYVSGASASSCLQSQPHLHKEQNVTKSQHESNNKVKEATILERLDDMEQRFIGKINKLKRSILYDLQIKVDELKATLVLNHPVESRNITRNREILGFQLPITTLVEFLRLDKELETQDKKNALKSLMGLLVAGTGSVSDDLGKVFSATIHKDVQVLYTACGRKVKGVGKKNFSDTNFYKLLQDVLLQKHQDISAPFLISKLSRFLSGATDRDGGRQNRGVTEPMSEVASEATLDTDLEAGQDARAHTRPKAAGEAEASVLPEVASEAGAHVRLEAAPKDTLPTCLES